jgi:hypothetical protein
LGQLRKNDFANVIIIISTETFDEIFDTRLARKIWDVFGRYEGQKFIDKRFFEFFDVKSEIPVSLYIERIIEKQWRTPPQRMVYENDLSDLCRHVFEER